MTQDTDTEVSTDPDEPWKDKRTLQEHIEKGESYAEIADQYEGVSKHMIGERVRKFGLKAAGRIDGPRWEGTHKFAPLVTYNEVNVVFPIGVEYLKQMDPDYPDYSAADDVESTVNQGPNPVVVSKPETPDYIRFAPRFDRDGVMFELEWGPDVDGGASNDRTMMRNDTLHAYAQFPAPIATSFGLHELGAPITSIKRQTVGADTGGDSGAALFDKATESTDTDVGVDDGPDFEGPAVEISAFDPADRRMQVRLSNCSANYTPIGNTPTGDQAELEPVVKPLFELRHENRVQSYRLDPGKDYVDAYGLERGMKYAVNIVPVQHDGESHIGVGLHFGQDLDSFHESLHRTVSSYEAGAYNAAASEGNKRTKAFDQPVLYPGKTLLNAVGLPTVRVEEVNRDESDEIGDTIKRKSRVKLVPFDDAIALVPADDVSSATHE